MKKKTIIILLDGAGDRAIPDLENRTPLEAAKTPALDKLASRGTNGLFHATYFGQPLPSEIAHFIMFGYELGEFPGRGVLEALGSGITLDQGDVALLASSAHVENRDGALFLDLKNPPVSADEHKQLTTLLTKKYSREGLSVQFQPSRGLAGIVHITGGASPFITDTDPMVPGAPIIDCRPWQESNENSAAIKTAAVMKKYLTFLHKNLEEHDVNRTRKTSGEPFVNFVVTQRAGVMKPVQHFTQRYKLKGLSISSGAMYRGLCRYIGFEHDDISETSDPEQDMAERLALAEHYLTTHDIIHVHTKWPDKAAHDHDPIKKKEVLEAIDRGIGRNLDKLLRHEDLLILVAADHSTPSSGNAIHSGEPVPIIFTGPGMRVDRITVYNEIAAAGGALGCLRGREFFSMIYNYFDLPPLAGIVDDPAMSRFWPGSYTPFTLENDNE